MSLWPRPRLESKPALAGWVLARIGVVPGALALSLVWMGLAMIYVWPQPTTLFFGDSFRQLSEAPFAFPEGNPMQQRLLAPLLAWLIGLRGETYLYFPWIAFWAFSALVFLWLYQRKGFSPTESWLGCGVLTFSTTFLFTLSFPGYADTLGYLFLFIAFASLERGSPWGAIALPLAALTHEANLFMLPLLLWLACTRGKAWQRATGALLVLAAVPALLLWRVWLQALSPHPLVEYKYFGQGLLLFNLNQLYAMAPLGIFMAFRLFWLLPAHGLRIAARGRDWRTLVALALGLGAGLGQLLLAHDTSRLVGHAFPAVLMGLVLVREMRGEMAFRRYLTALFVLNLLVLPYYVGQNKPIRMESLPEKLIYDAVFRTPDMLFFSGG